MRLTCFIWTRRASSAIDLSGGRRSTSPLVALLIYEVLKLDPRHARRADGGQRRARSCCCSSSSPLAPAGDRQLADPQHARLRRVRGHRAVPVGHPARARALRPGAVLPRSRRGRDRRRDDRGARRRPPRRWPAQRIGAIVVIERQIGLRNYIESGIPLDAHGHLRPAGQHLPADVAAARRRRDHPGRPHRRGRLLPAADRESAAQPRARHAPSRRHRPHRGERRRGRRGVGGDRRASRSCIDGRHRARPLAGPLRAAAAATAASATPAQPRRPVDAAQADLRWRPSVPPPRR